MVNHLDRVDDYISRISRLRGTSTYRTAFILVFLAVSILSVALVAWPVTPSNIASITVRRSEVEANGSGSNYGLSADEAGQVVNALQGTTESVLPENVVATYEMTVNLKGLFPRRYDVYITSTREVYFRRSISSRIMRSEDPLLFYTHEAFLDLYPHGQMPIVSIVAKDEYITPVVDGRTWHVLKWDDAWHEGQLPPLAESTEQWPVQNSMGDGITVAVDSAPDKLALRVTNPTGKIVYDGALAGRELPLFPRNGLYNYQLALTWEDEALSYRGHYMASFSVIVDLPTAFYPPGPTIVQGELATFYALHVPEGMVPVLETELATRVQFFPYEDGYVAYLPTHYGNTPGEYILSYGLEGEPGMVSTLTVLPRDFRVQHLTVSPSVTAATRNDEAYEQFGRFFPQSRETSAPDRYYDQSFVVPVFGRLTTEFGQIRYTNNATAGSRHSGLDIAAPTGTPIVATNTGRVTLAMDLILTGNTLVIDHGQGLFSVHYHMHELFVEEGQLVPRGETVGTVGSTGFSTGPHLHFTMSYYQHNLEPGFFLVGEPLTFANATRHLTPVN